MSFFSFLKVVMLHVKLMAMKQTKNTMQANILPVKTIYFLKKGHVAYQIKGKEM